VFHVWSLARLVTNGYRPIDCVIEALERWLAAEEAKA
jgi:hypothetical protein